MLRYLTSGESHGRCLLAIVDGVPAGLYVDKSVIDGELARRMSGYGRGKRMAMESDHVRILSGLRASRTMGSPIAMMIDNLDHSIDKLPVVSEPRPGHADLSGALKYDLKDVRSVLERASARETASRVSVGGLCKILLTQFGVRITSHVIIIGGIRAEIEEANFARILKLCERSPVRCADLAASRAMCKEIDRAGEAGDTLGGVFEIMVKGVVPGLGSYAQWDRRMDAMLARAVISIPAVKGVSFGAGFEAAQKAGSAVHDEILYDRKKGFSRKTNNAGGIEGGITNGENIIIRAAMKPISTLKRPLESVNVRTKKPVLAAVERSDICAVPAAGVVGEAAVAIELAGTFLEKFGGDSIIEMKRNYRGYLEQVRKF